MCYADLAGDGENRLVVATGKKLKVFKGTQMISEHALLERPSCIISFCPDNESASRVAGGKRMPMLAVAAGSQVFIYRKMRPYFKFTLPRTHVAPAEAAAWRALADRSATLETTLHTLARLRDAPHGLTADRSHELLELAESSEGEAELVAEWASRVAGEPLAPPTVTTCMGVLSRDGEEDENGVGLLVLGLEDGTVLVLDESTSKALVTVRLPSAPVVLKCTGSMKVDYRIVVACRDAHVYTIKDGVLQRGTIELDSQSCGLTRANKLIVVACMNSTLQTFSLKGRRQHSAYLPSPAVALEALTLERNRQLYASIVALRTGEVRVYLGKNLVGSYAPGGGEPIAGMCFGSYGREDAVLSLSYVGGALAIKILPRSTDLEAKAQSSGPPPEQDIPLAVPRKTRLFVEQTQREREQGVDMHRIFQRDLCKLRLNTARAYVKVLTDGQGPVSYVAGSSLRLNAQVQGFGPHFNLQLGVQNTGAKAVRHVPITLACDESLYLLERSQLVVPVLVPGLTYTYTVRMTCLAPEAGVSGVVKVYVVGNSRTPLLSAVVKMPVSEPDIEEGL